MIEALYPALKICKRFSFSGGHQRPYGKVAEMIQNRRHTISGSRTALYIHDDDDKERRHFSQGNNQRTNQKLEYPLLPYISQASMRS